MKIMTLPCDGIGPEIMAATLQVVHAANDSFDLRMTFHEEISGFDSLRAHGVTLRDAVLEQARTAFEGVILGTQSHMDYPPVAEGGATSLPGSVPGSLGLAGSINANAETGLCRAQAQHGSAPDIAGQNVANPTSLILSAAMMLSWLGEQRGVPKLMQAGKAIADAVDAVIDDPAKRTRDLGGDVNTDAFGRFVADALMGKAAAA